MSADTVPEYLLKDEDEDELGDDVDIDVDPCTLSPSTLSPWPLMSSASENDGFLAVDNILSTFTSTSHYCCCSFFMNSANGRYWYIAVMPAVL